MGRQSSLKTLPKEILDEVNRLLVDDNWSIDDVVAHLNEAGFDKSRSAVGRHRKNIFDVAGKLRQSRETAQALIREIGPAATEGKTGRLLIEILQKLVFDHLLAKVDDDGDGDGKSTPKDFMTLARALKDMAFAQKTDTDREVKIRDLAAKAMRKKAAEVGGASARKAGLTKKTVDDIKSAILGIEAAQ